METIIVISILLAVAVTVAIASPVAIKHFSRRPANGEVGRLSGVHAKMCKNAEHLTIVCNQPKNKPHVRHI